MKQKGFTLIELLVVIAIIGLLASIVLSSLSSVRSKGRIAAGQQQDTNFHNAIGDRILGEWTFDDGASASDTSGSGHAGTLVNSPTFSTDTAAGRGFSVAFNGSSNYIKIGPVTSGSVLTYAFWIKVASKPASNQILLWDDDAHAGGDSAIYLLTNGDIQNVSNFVTTAISSQSIQTNEWEFVAVSADAAGTRIYLDGSLSAQTATTLSSRSGISYVTLGAGYDGGGLIGGGQFFSGSIDDVRIYAASLTSEAVERLYAQGAAQHGIALK